MWERFVRTLVFVALVVPPGLGEVRFLGPTPYREFSDSPCLTVAPFTGSFLEDFEDGLVSFPLGIYDHPGIVQFPSATTDSVDGDDGVLDGSGSAGHSFLPTVVIQGPTFPPRWQTQYVLSFDESTHGFLPTCIGLVVTDGISPNFISLTAFDAVGSQFNVLTSDVMLSSLDNGDTSEDRFMGAWSADGIRELRITHTYASVLFARRFEIDHVQYFYNNVPENFGNTTIHALAFFGRVGVLLKFDGETEIPASSAGCASNRTSTVRPNVEQLSSIVCSNGS